MATEKKFPGLFTTGEETSKRNWDEFILGHLDPGSGCEEETKVQVFADSTCIHQGEDTVLIPHRMRGDLIHALQLHFDAVEKAR